MFKLEGYMIHNSTGGEEFLFQSHDGYFYVYDGDGMYAPATKEELDKFELGEELQADLLVHVLKFSV